MIAFQDYKHIIPIQIRFSDIDRINHVNNACYLNYFELSRVTYFNKVFGEHIHWDKKGFVLARTEINHLISILINDDIFCATKTTAIGNKSLTVKNSIFKKQGGTFVECANGVGILVAMNYAVGESMEVPEVWRGLVREFEGPEVLER
jgi:acyl-CoA thioester hydrolase